MVTLSDGAVLAQPHQTAPTNVNKLSQATPSISRRESYEPTEALKTSTPINIKRAEVPTNEMNTKTPRTYQSSMLNIQDLAASTLLFRKNLSLTKRQSSSYSVRRAQDGVRIHPPSSDGGKRASTLPFSTFLSASGLS